METKELKAGKELDQRIALEVMGWKWRERPRGVQRAEWDMHEWPILTPAGCGYSSCSVPDFSSDIAAAWTVFEKLEEPSIYRRGKLWRCHAVRAGNTWEDAPTAPLAICLAALAAMEQK